MFGKSKEPSPQDIREELDPVPQQATVNLHPMFIAAVQAIISNSSYEFDSVDKKPFYIPTEQRFSSDMKYILTMTEAMKYVHAYRGLTEPRPPPDDLP